MRYNVKMAINMKKDKKRKKKLCSTPVMLAVLNGNGNMNRRK